MKKLLILFSVILMVIQVFAQAPQKMSFQAVIRKSNNGLVMMQPVSMRISILQGNANGTIVYQETHKPITNSNGLVTLEIGTGTIIVGTFSRINWGTGPFFIKTETDPLCGTDYTIVGVSEFLSVPYALFALNAVGLQGPQGLQGLTGATGVTGAQGDIGLIGATGLQGLTGLTGATGPQGVIGLTGSQGLVGVGLTGAMGPQGLMGLTGATGSQGVIGLTGARGLNGLTGATGATGFQGFTGLTGPAGSDGLTGAQGLTGSIGANGPQGIQGNTGLTGAEGKSAYELAVMNGFVGTSIDFIASLKGVNGNTGAQGINGLTGSTGATGSQGLIGLTGATGLTGAVGSQGPQGASGTAGTNGSNGVDGAIGLTGPQGVIGLTGAIGSQGVIGNTGLQGITGFTGATGGQGIQGASGTAGTNGATGPIGPQGDIGNTGSQGVIGLTGPIGPQGDIGLTGPTGGFNPASILLPQNGGTGIVNNTLSTLTITGANPMTFTNTGITAITLPTSGTLYGTSNASISSLNIFNSLSNKTGTGDPVFAISPAFTVTPTAPTAAIGTNTTQLATTEFVMQNNAPTQFSITSGTEISTTTTSDALAGDMALTPGAGKYFVTFNSQYTISTSDRIGLSKTDLSNLYTTLMAKPTTVTSHSVTFASETLLAGVYSTTGASTAAGIITLDAGGNPNAEFIFKFGGAFSTAASTTIVLINGASACNVYWIAEGAIALGTNTSMYGTMIANNDAITIASGSIIVGRLFSTAGAIGFDHTNLSLPVCSSPTNYGMLNSFAAYTSAGALTNTGITTISGDIGTDVGAITGFESATINGYYFAPSLTSRAAASFSIYQNGILIPFSTRTRINTLNLAEVYLTAIATVGASEAIDIRWKIDAGTIKLQNRILTLIAVK